jgi:bifunctional non-homologous end joining protein LigD
MAANGKLSTYRAKRDFTRTAEPSGEVQVKESPVLRYVIQKHAATRLHYDFRLELDGVFKSWAVTRGPSIDPHDRRLAVEVEDHPLDYGDFEGTIPKGQYGGGSVMLWDRGYWMPEGDPVRALEKGDLKFALEGEKLHGGWVLVRIKNKRRGDKKNNWLLIKHRDDFSRDGDNDALLADATSVASGRAMEQIVAGKGRGPSPFMLDTKSAKAPDAVWNSNHGSAAELRAANITSAVHSNAKPAASPDGEARPATPRKSASGKHKTPMPEFVAPQLSKAVDRPPAGAGWVHEIKFDGYRIQMRIESGRVTLRTRKGLDWTRKFGALAEAAADLPDAIIDGEVVVLNENAVPEFTALQAALAGGGTGSMVYFAFDLLFADGEDLRALPLRERKSRLAAMLEKLPEDSPIRYVDHFDVEGSEVLDTARRMHLEGIISKRVDSPYREGSREGWTKTKCRNGQDVVIGGWSSDGSRFRSLLVGVYRDRQLSYAGRVGTGFGEDVVDQILPRLKAVETDQSPFVGPNAPKRESDVHWAKPELVAEIEFSGWTTDGLVRQSAFKGLRDDIAPSDVGVEKPAPVEEVEVAKPPPPKSRPNAFVAPKPKSGGIVRVMGIDISHPNKEMWPDAGDGKPVAKIELARYYETVGEFIVAHIKGRPCSIVRAPEGIKGELFFQRHGLKGMDKSLKLVKVTGDHQPYLQIDSHAALIAVGQIAALELHPWNCQPDEPEIPGRLVFDFDPAPDVQFDVVIQAARELRDRLTALGLVSFCKTTGGKGLHIVTPLARAKKDPLTWPEAKTFAHHMVMQMAADSPDRYLTTMAKKARSGKIFLDYLRNDRMSTAVAPLSPRAREGATISMPVEWPQVRPGLDPKRFTIRTAPELFAKSKAWADYDDAARSLEAAIKRLGKSRAA